MATEVPSFSDLYDLFETEVQNVASDLTDFEEGAINDVLGGAFSVGAEELSRLIIEKFNKTFFSTAHGPEVTGGPDDLEFLATDHFGDSFARPEAQAAIGTVTFSRPTTDAGNVTIPAGSIVKTNANSQGVEQRFSTDSEVILTGLSIDASVTAVEPGTSGNVLSGTVINIESTLTDDTVVVTNDDPMSGGVETQTDAEYREFIRNKIEIIRGATKAAVEAAALNVPGIVVATAVENLQSVIEWDIGSSSTVGDFFFIPRVKLYVADINGTASAALIEAVEDAIFDVRACGVFIEVIAATPLSMDWDASVSLNPSGPNFALFSSDPTLIEQTMAEYIRDLAIGEDFNRNLARAAILAIWGPSGTDDLTDFVTNEPLGTIDISAPTKLIPGTVSIS